MIQIKVQNKDVRTRIIRAQNRSFRQPSLGRPVLMMEGEYREQRLAQAA